MRAVLASLVMILPLAGCLSAVGLPDAACPAPELALLTGPREASAISRAPGEPVPLLYWARNPHAFNATLYGGHLPGQGALDPRDPDARHGDAGIPHEVGPGGLAFGGFRAPVADVQTEMVFQAELSPARDDPGAPDCNMTGLAFETLPLAPPVERDLAAIGKGVLVRTGGFWTNGTSFYTNHASVDGNAAIPKGYLGPYDGDEPLKVYVYAEGETTPPKRYQDAGFAMTIPGFNTALAGFPVGTARLAYLTPEEAYTREGREAHPLYGEALLFWIEVDEVVDLPCPLPQPACDLPGVPSLPVPPLA